jgi:hypothetical protein
MISSKGLYDNQLEFKTFITQVAHNDENKCMKTIFMLVY